MKSLLQIVPQVPGTMEGVSDYALNLARALRSEHNIETTFAVARPAAVRDVEGFSVLANVIDAGLSSTPENVLLHYVNYAYQPRGVPSRLQEWARNLRGRATGRWITMFHELYASGRPWQSAFWLRPLQVRIARQIIDASDACFVSNLTIANEITRHAAPKEVHVLPVMSNLGEPELNNFADRSPHRWVICGGDALIARSLDSLAKLRTRIPTWAIPHELDVIGGTRATEFVLEDIVVRHHPRATVAAASALLREGRFGWIDYFGKGKSWPAMIFKSGAYAAYCAHGVIPIVTHEERELGLRGDNLPGPFSLTQRQVHLPGPSELAIAAGQVYRWYRRNASTSRIAQEYAVVLL